MKERKTKNEEKLKIVKERKKKIGRKIKSKFKIIKLFLYFTLIYFNISL